MSGAHHFLAPSAAGRWVRCAYAPALEAAYPQTEDGPESLEGTAAHWVNEMTMMGTPPAVDAQAPNGTATTLQMLEGAEMVLEDIERTLGPAWRSVLRVEQRVQISRTQNAGTPDYVAWTRTSDGRPLMILWDYKFGYGVVEVFENWQLLNYVMGLLEAAGFVDQTVVVDMRIVQPRAPHRAGPVRSWRVLASDLRGYFNRLEHAARVANAPNPVANPTPEGCHYCAGRHACEALQRAAFGASAYAQQGAAFDLTPHAMGLELRELTRARDLLDARVTGLKAQAESCLKRGQSLPFWSLQSTPGRMAWSVSTPEVLVVGQMMGVNLAKPVEPVTPTQAKAAGLPESVVNLYARRPPGAVKLTPDDGSKARLTFSSGVA